MNRYLCECAHLPVRMRTLPVAHPHTRLLLITYLLLFRLLINNRKCRTVTPCSNSTVDHNLTGNGHLRTYAGSVVNHV